MLKYTLLLFSLVIPALAADPVAPPACLSGPVSQGSVTISCVALDATSPNGATALGPGLLLEGTLFQIKFHRSGCSRVSSRTHIPIPWKCGRRRNRHNVHAMGHGGPGNRQLPTAQFREGSACCSRTALHLFPRIRSSYYWHPGSRTEGRKQPKFLASEPRFQLIFPRLAVAGNRTRWRQRVSGEGRCRVSVVVRRYSSGAPAHGKR
jgi:hypothetical protein